MKKVLIVAHLFHASPRIPGLSKYLPEFGWQPIILTPPLGEDPDSRLGPPNNLRDRNRVIETYGYNAGEDMGLRIKKQLNLTSRELYGYVRPFLRFLYRHYLEITHYPDKERNWKLFAVNAGKEVLQNEHVEAMISSSSPVTAHLIANELKDKYDIPWVADFRDLWTQNHSYPYSRLRKMFERRLEVKTLSRADALVTTSQPWAEKLKMLHKKEAHTITNGFDPDMVSDGKVDLTSSFTITYTGQVYTRKQNPSRLLSALKDLIIERALDPKDIRVRFYGPLSEQLEKETVEYGLSGIVKQYGIIPRQDSFARQRESQLLLLLNWDDSRERGVYTGKVFEYLAAQRPILATGGFGNDVVEALLEETNSGVYCSTVEDIKRAIRDSYREYRSKGRVTYNGDMEKVNKYSYREMARKFVRILTALMKGGD